MRSPFACPKHVRRLQPHTDENAPAHILAAPAALDEHAPRTSSRHPRGTRDAQRRVRGHSVQEGTLATEVK